MMSRDNEFDRLLLEAKVVTLEVEVSRLQNGCSRMQTEIERLALSESGAVNSQIQAQSDLQDAHQQIERLTREVDVLRRYGNKDCTAMADEALTKGSHE